MMKRRALFLLGFVFIVSVMLLLSSCNHVPLSETKTRREESKRNGYRMLQSLGILRQWLLGRTAAAILK